MVRQGQLLPEQAATTVASEPGLCSVFIFYELALHYPCDGGSTKAFITMRIGVVFHNPMERQMEPSYKPICESAAESTYSQNFRTTVEYQ